MQRTWWILASAICIASCAAETPDLTDDPSVDMPTVSDADPWAIVGDAQGEADASSRDQPVEADAAEDAAVIPQEDTGPSGSQDTSTEIVTQPGEFQHPCDGPEDCFSGYCVDSPTGQVCSKTCEVEGGCPTGWSCSETSGGADVTFICVPDDAFLCRPCESDGDCNVEGLPATGVCLDVGAAGSFCTRRCDTKACPTSFQCEPTKPYGDNGPTMDLCLAESADVCTCTSKFVTENARTACRRENEYGTCYGESVCLEVGPLPTCSADEPQQETCNGIDDDCDGETDEDASDCTVFYADTDGDGYGLGYGECLCEQPGPNWLLEGGDCNEQVTAINPGATEVCGNFQDDNCNGEIDEEGAFGCVTHYLDMDNDGYGTAGESRCLCEGEAGWATQLGDCNDMNPSANPGVVEMCDTVDNDCDGAVDEEGSQGCMPFWHDSDGDTYGLTDQFKCLCGPTGVYLGNKDNDCDDTTTAINPGVVELCNGYDDNCDGEIDEGDALSMCPQVASGAAACVEGTCALVSCDAGWSDADGDPLNGCECPVGQLEDPGVGDVCIEAKDLGTVMDNGDQLQVTDNIASDDPLQGDEDWYKFTAVDGADPNGCDSFNLRISFLHNPQDQFVFDVYQGGCAGSQEICTEVDLFTHTTNINTTIGTDLVGECPCHEGEETVPDFQQCSDQTDVFIVRVRRRFGFSATCAAYTLKIENG